MCSTTAQQDPKWSIDKSITYILRALRLSIKYRYLLFSIIAMVETSVLNDMVSNTAMHWQGAKSVCLITIGYVKSMVSVCSAAKVDGTKLKPFIVSAQRKENFSHLMKNSNPLVQLRVLVTPG